MLRLSGRDLNEEMVREGHAWAYRRYLGSPYASGYIGAEDEARRAGRGSGGSRTRSRLGSSGREAEGGEASFPPRTAQYALQSRP